MYCIGDVSDVPLLEKVKYGISFDVQCMVDGAWIDSLKNSGMEEDEKQSRADLIAEFIAYNNSFFAQSEG